MDTTPTRYAILYSDSRDWLHMKCNEWIRLKDIDAWCSIQGHTIRKLQVFNARNQLLMNRTFHPLLDEVTNG